MDTKVLDTRTEFSSEQRRQQLDVCCARIGENIRRIRRQRGWSIERLAHKAHVGVFTLLRIENSQRYPSVPVLIKIASALQVPVDELVSIAFNNTHER